MANRQRFRWVVAVLTPMLVASAVRAVEFPGRQPGPATAVVKSDEWRLENAVLRAAWRTAEGRLRPGPILDQLSGRTISGGSELFSIVLSGGKTIPASAMKVLAPPRSERLPIDVRAARASSHCAGKCISATLATDDGTVHVEWRAMLRDGDNYVRQELSLRARGADLPLAEVVLADLAVEEAGTAGDGRGSPVVAGKLFFACESPLAENQGRAGRVRCGLPSRARCGGKLVPLFGSCRCRAGGPDAACLSLLRRARASPPLSTLSAL